MPNTMDKEVSKVLETIRREDNGEKILEILYILSYFNPNICIDRSVFSMIVGNAEELETSIELIQSYSLVESDYSDSTFFIEEKFQKAVRSYREKNKTNKDFRKQALRLLLSFDYKDGIGMINLKHLRSVLKCAGGYRVLIEDLCEMSDEIIFELLEQNSEDEYFRCFEEIKDIMDTVLKYGETDSGIYPDIVFEERTVESLYTTALEHLVPLTWYSPVEPTSPEELSLDDVTVGMQELGNKAFRLSLFKSALIAYKEAFCERQVSDTESIEDLNAWHCYAMTLNELDRSSESLGILRQVLKKQYEILDSTDDGMSAVKCSVGNALMKQKRPVEALKYFEEALEVRSKSLGEMHEDTLRTKCDMALVFLSEGNYETALEMCKDTAQAFRNVLGELHSDTLVALSNLASVFYLKGEYSKSLEIYRDVLEKYTITLGAKHIETLKTKHNMASTLLRLGNNGESLAIFEQVLGAYYDIFGKNHEETVELKASIDYLKTTFKTLNEQLINQTLHVYLVKDDNLNKISSFIEKNGADVNFKDAKGRTPLHDAAESGLVRIVKLLLEKGAIYNSICGKGKQPLQLTQSSEIKRILSFVEATFEAVRKKDYKQLSEYLCNELLIANARDADGSSLLHWTASFGKTDLSKLLLKGQADATLVNNAGDTPLHIAVSNLHTEVVKCLLQSVDSRKLRKFVNAKTVRQGNTALHIAAKRGSLDMIKIFLKHGAVFDVRNENGETPLEMCKDKNCYNFLKLINEMFRDDPYNLLCIKNKNFMKFD